MIVVFTGGTGGTKLVQGLQQVIAPEDLTVIVNTGDDIEWWGLHVSPDIDSVLYGLSGLLSKDRGWGVNDDTFRCLERMKQLGQPSWFSLGDLDLATHLTRTVMLKAGKSLSQATVELANRLGIRARVLPMSDDRVATMLDTAKGMLTFQEYFVRERHQVKVHAVSLRRRREGACGSRSAREYCVGRGNCLRSEQSCHQHRTDPGGAWSSRRAADYQSSKGGGESYRWWGCGFRACGRADGSDGLGKHA